MLNDNVEKPRAALPIQQAPPTSNLARPPTAWAEGACPRKPRGALPPIKLAQVTHMFQVHWLFRVGAHGHQEAYDSEREATEQKLEPATFKY